MPASPRKAFALTLAPIFLIFALAWGRLPISDPPEYFRFTDERALAGIPNAWNVLSNLPFVIAAWELLRLSGREKTAAYRRSERWLAAGLLLTTAGSAYFHWSPDPDTLFWDRLPMAISFTGIFLMIVADRFSERLSLALSYPVLLASVLTVLYWRNFQDVRPYVALQFGLIVFVLIASVTRQPGRIPRSAVLSMGLIYVCAKLVETADAAIYQWLGGISAGHAIKHLLAALAVVIFARGLERSSQEG